MHDIAVVIIASNEAHNIGRCVRSAKQVSSEVHVLLSNTTDNTADIAINEGAQVHHVVWKGYGATKNMATLLTEASYLLSLDADEEITADLACNILELSLSANTIYAVNRSMFYEGQWIRHSGWYPDWCPRLYHRDVAEWSDDMVHEKLLFEPALVVKKLDGHLNHYSYTSIEDHKSRIEKYAKLKAIQWEKGRGPSFFRRYLGGIAYFIKAYVVKLGFLDGKAGWTIAKMNYHMARTQIRQYDLLKKES